MEVRIQSVRFNADEKLINYIENKIEKLKKFNDSNEEDRSQTSHGYLGDVPEAPRD